MKNPPMSLCMNRSITIPFLSLPPTNDLKNLSKTNTKKNKKNKKQLLPRFSWVSLLDGYGQRSIGPKLFPCTFQDQVMEEKWCPSLAGRLSHHVSTYICIYQFSDIQINTYTHLHLYISAYIYKFTYRQTYEDILCTYINTFWYTCWKIHLYMYVQI